MPEAQSINGQCLCGAVAIAAKPRGYHLDACHCNMCRRWGGGPLLVVHCDDDMRIDGAAEVTVYESSEWAERAFCSRCGTHLFYRLKQGGLLAIPVGLVDEGRDWQLALEIFIEEKPGYYALAGDRERLTGEEVIARYGTP